jgi:hypothetical protein
MFVWENLIWIFLYDFLIGICNSSDGALVLVFHLIKTHVHNSCNES